VATEGLSGGLTKERERIFKRIAEEEAEIFSGEKKEKTLKCHHSREG